MKSLNFKHLRLQPGFTLIEVLISSFVFSIIMSAVSGLFVQTLSNQRRAFAGQEVQENGLFILELMSREIRVSQIQNQDSADCSRTTLTISHPVNGTVIYSLAGNVLQRTAGGTVTDLSSSGVSFQRLNFCVVGSGPTDRQQTRVAILASVRNRTGKDIQTINLQTTVSSRDVQTEF